MESALFGDDDDRPRMLNERSGERGERPVGTPYVIDPRELIRAQREARGRGLEIVGFYHSHPDHPARPSATDLEHAHWIGCSYLITSASASGAGQTKSFLLAGKLEEDKHFVEEQIVTQADCAQND